MRGCFRTIIKLVGWGFALLIILIIIANMGAPDEKEAPQQVAAVAEVATIEPTALPIVATHTTIDLTTDASTPVVFEDSCTKVVKQEGRNEPEYVGLSGYIVNAYPDNYSDALPAAPWGVPLIEQVGPDSWSEGSQTLPHRTPVVVLEQHLVHEGYGRYSGFLVLKSLEDSKEYRVNHYNFVPTDYWNCPAHQAVKYSSFIAIVQGDVKPVNKDGEWEEMGEQRDVFCNGTPGIGSDGWVENGVECLMYKNYRYGFGGVTHIFPSASLEIVY